MMTITAQAGTGLGSGGTVLNVSGMTCGSCVGAITRALSRVPGVSQVHADIDSGTVAVDGNAPGEALVTAIEAAGFAATLSTGEAAGQKPDRAPGGCC